MSLIVGDRDLLERIVHHVFLPPQLPQTADDSDLDAQLLKLAHKALSAFRDIFSTNQRPLAIDSAIVLLSNTVACHTSVGGAIDEAELSRVLGSITVGQSLSLRVRAQNAGLVITRKKDHLLFEVFELSPQNGDVLAAKGRLVRQFPGSAVLVPSATSQTPGFQATVAQALAQMSVQPASGMQPKIEKKGSQHDEERDTPHPWTVSGLFVAGFLKALGDDAKVQPVLKHMSDEVSWEDAEMPWRRSSTWTLVRVGLQFILSRSPGGSIILYKSFGAFLVAELLHAAQSLHLSLDLQFFMNCKLSSRLQKLTRAGSAPLCVRSVVQKSLSMNNTALKERWDLVTQQSQARQSLDLSSLKYLSLASDSVTELSALDEYLVTRCFRRSNDAIARFVPHSELLEFAQYAFPHLPAHGSGLYHSANLQRFEDWIYNGLRSTVSVSTLDEVCGRISHLVKVYHRLTSALYCATKNEKDEVVKRGNPEGMSNAILCVLELWVAMDRCAVENCGLLGEYDPAIPVGLFQNLLLPFKAQMKRLRAVEGYLHDRMKTTQATQSNTGLFGPPRNANCFATRYFDKYQQHTDLFEEIQTQGHKGRQLKEQEFESLKAVHTRLTQQALQMEHTFVAVSPSINTILVQPPIKKHDETQCIKCLTTAEAASLFIRVHEWPLPTNEAEAKAVVFELQVPSWYANWRDATVYLLQTVLKSKPPAGKPVQKKDFALYNDPHLKDYYRPDEDQNIILWTSKKSHASTHWRKKLVVKATFEDVCVANGTHYEYLQLVDSDEDESEIGYYIGTFPKSLAVAHDCTYNLPARSKQIQESLFRPHTAPDGISPNAVIANQSACPPHMTNDEFKELSTLPLGHGLQWYNILLQIAAPTVDFKKEETVLVFLQCIYQAGPPCVGDEIFEHDPLRASHNLLTHTVYVRRLLGDLRAALQKIKGNWESMNALIVFAAVASRILSLNGAVQFQKECLLFLAEVRRVSFAWLGAIRTRAHAASSQAEHSHYLVKCVEVALVCSTTFNVEHGHLSHILSSEENASILLQCSLILAERRRTDEGLIPLLAWRLQRTLCAALPIVSETHVGVDAAVTQMWSAYCRDESDWQQVEGSPWLQTTHEETLIYLNLLTGEFLVDGLRLSKPPRVYERHAIYKALFNDSDVEVMPSRRPGMSFSTKMTYHGFSVHLGMDATAGSQILIQASAGLRTYEVIPSRLFRGSFPDHFVDDFVHWLDIAHDAVQFRPSSAPWDSTSPSIWTLSRAYNSNGWHLRNGDSCVHGLASPTARTISEFLSPLAESPRVHVTLQHSRASVVVEIPTLRLSFTLDWGESLLRSKEYRGMVLDSDQSIGALVGFTNSMVLRPLQKGSRKLLLPEGPVSYQRLGDHMIVSVDRANVVAVHPFDIDDRLGRLVDNGSVQSKLLLAYLHALTSFPLADSLTRTTGTEQALKILRSAATRSFQQLSEDNVDILLRISKLTPERSYYPSTDKVMQKVTWDAELSFLSQTGHYYKAVHDIFDQAKRSKLFYPGSNLHLPVLDHSDDELLNRSLVLSSAFTVAGSEVEYQKSREDVMYVSRDRDEGSERAKNACMISRLVNLKIDMPHWKTPDKGQLWNDFKTREVVFGASRAFDSSMLRYDAVLLLESEASVKTNLLSLHAASNTQEGRKIEMFALMMWLSTMAFSEYADLPMLQTVAMLFTSTRFRALQPPETESFSPSLGLDLPKPSKNKDNDPLYTSLLKARVEFEDSPDFDSPVRPNESELMARRRRPDDYDRRSKAAIWRFCESLREQWPCHVPETPPAAKWKDVVPYINIAEAMRLAKVVFKTFSDNRLLYNYLQDLQVILAGFSTKFVHVPTWLLNAPKPLADGNCNRSGYISVENVFKGHVPQIPEPPQLDIEEHSQPLGHSEPRTSRLCAFLETVQASSAAPYQLDDIRDLQRSAASLENHGQNHAKICLVPGEMQLSMHLTRCEQHLKRVSATLRDSIDKQLRSVSGATDSLQWPKASPVLFLEQLSRNRWPHLSDDWQNAIIQFGLAITAVQRAERLLKLHAKSAVDDLRRELQSQKPPGYEHKRYPESLLLEAESGIQIRAVQEQIAAVMRSPPGGRNSVMQLNMGEGKSSVIVPMVAASLATGKQLVRVIVAKPQSKQMAQMLISKIGGLMNRRVYYMPYSRALRLDKESAESIEALCHDCKLNGGVLLVQPEHLLSFNLTGLESYIAGNESAGKTFLRIQDFFDNESRDIIDESDENFSVRFELIYTMGLRRPTEFSPYRWTLIQQILGLVHTLAVALSHHHPSALEIHKRPEGGFPRLRILQHEVAQLLVTRLAEHICTLGLRDFPLALQAEPVRKAVFVYITKIEITALEAHAVEKSAFWTEHTKCILLLLRGLIAGGILEFVFCAKRWRVNYGLTDRSPATRLAVPYRAKDSPAPRSEYSLAEIVILLTSLSYYYEGLSNDDLFAAFNHLMASDQADEQYASWTQDVQVDPAFHNLSGINLKDSAHCVSKLFKDLRYSKEAIDYFLSHIVFAKEMKEYPFKLSASGCDIGRVKTLPTTGFSGTNDTRNLLPLDVQQLDLPDQSHTNALVLGNILQTGNSVALLAKASDASRTDAQRLLDLVMQLRPLPEVVLDVGAQILELSNRDVAKAWLRQTDAFLKEAAVFCDDNDDLCVIDRQDREELLHTSSFSSRLDVCLVYLDEAHTRGIDLQLPMNYRAAVTLGPHLTKDRLVQACMRMRKLGKGQTVVFCIPDDIALQIRETGQKPKDHAIGVEDVLRYVIGETYAEIQQCMPLWTVQNFNFTKQLELWSLKGNNKDGKRVLTQASAEMFREPEVRTLEVRYGPRVNQEPPLNRLERATNPRYKAIEQRCRKLGNPDFNLRKLTAQQERELSPEIDVDAERELQKPPPAKAALHNLHQDLVKFAETGIALSNSKAYSPAFEVLRRTSAGEQFDVSQLRQPYLLATTDFARTVAKPGTGSLSDSYQRSVQWILTGRMLGRTGVSYMIIVSPFEAQKLIGRVQKSTVVALHLYRPRYSLGFRPMEKLDFYTISQGQVSLEVPMQISVQLSIFAGQLYFSSYEQYRAACKFLGLAAEPPKKNWVVAPDGFILSDGDNQPGGAGSHIRQSPVNFLKLLMSKIRRNGEDISKSHVGAILEGRLLSVADFDKED